MFDLHALLRGRGFASDEAIETFLNSRDSLDPFLDPVPSQAMEEACDRIRFAVKAGESIGIYGDYDCDGVTSATILTRYLRRGMGAEVRTRLPDRFKDGYGLHPGAVNQLADKGVSVLLTCDNGVAAHAGVDRCIDRGIDCIVTDHHRVPDELPEAFCIVHPQVAFPAYRDLCGAGVAFLLVIALEGGLSKRLESFLDLVALGTLGDMVPLDGLNRPLVWHGIQRMKAGLGHPGTKALLTTARTVLETMTARDLAFGVCPRINAAGRLETPDVCFEMMMTNDKTQASLIAGEVDRLNRERRELAKEQDLVVMRIVNPEDTFMVVQDPSFHAGLIGLSANKLVERYKRPAIVFAPTEDGTWRGSGRSPAGFNLYDAMEACKEYLIAFGGHAYAAGCRVHGSDIPGLAEALGEYTLNSGWEPQGIVPVDYELAPSELDASVLEQLERLEPTGQRNLAPTFGFRGPVEKVRIVKDHAFLAFDGVDMPYWFGAKDAPGLGEFVDLHYRMDGEKPVVAAIKTLETYQ